MAERPAAIPMDLGWIDARCPHRSAVALGSARVDVRSNSTPALSYLRKLFSPGNELWRVTGDPLGSPALIVRYYAAGEQSVMNLVDELHARGAGLKNSSVRLHAGAPALQFCLENERRVLVAGGRGQAIAPQVIITDGRSITIVCGDTPDAMMNLARHLREAGYRLAENDGWVCLHASAASLGGRTTAIVGESGAGKTTMALALAALPGWAFLANDRLMIKLSPSGARLHAVALPCPIRLNAGTLAGLAIDDAPGWHLARPRPQPGSDWSAFRGAAKLNVLPCEWQEFTGTDLGAAGDLAAVLFPRPEPGAASLRIAAETARAGELIAAQCVSPDDPVYVEDWLRFRRVSAERISGNARRIVNAMAHLPSLSLEFGTELPLAHVAEQAARTIQAAG